MKHIELVSCIATAPGAGGAAAAAVTGDSLTIKNGKGPKIIGIWADFQAAGVLQIIRPSGHDTTRDLRFRVPATEVDFRNPIGIPIDVEPQELLGVTIIGSATAGDVETACLLVGYDELPGSSQNLISESELMRKIDKLLTIECSITTAGNGVTYSGEELINAESALLKANRNYAILGANVGAECAAVTVRGPDTGNVRIGLPGNDLDNNFTSQFFPLLSRAFGKPLIPVINSGNAASTYFGALADENNTAIPVSWTLALLK